MDPDTFDMSDFEDDDWDEPEGPHYENLSNTELMETFFDLKNDLLTRGVLLEPVTSEDMSKQSTYLGLLSTMRERNLC
jgi:hypothetical protein